VYLYLLFLVISSQDKFFKIFYNLEKIILFFILYTNILSIKLIFIYFIKYYCSFNLFKKKTIQIILFLIKEILFLKNYGNLINFYNS
jgi:hypothetical protein